MLINKRTNLSHLVYNLVWMTRFTTNGKPENIFKHHKGELMDILIEIARNNNMVIKRGSYIRPNFVHLVVTMPPRLAVSSAVKAFKGRSARIMFTKHPDLKEHLKQESNSKRKTARLWSPTFIATTVSNEDTNNPINIEEYLKGKLIKIRQK